MDNLTKLLNFVAREAVFRELTTAQILEYHKLLAWAQYELIPKLEGEGVRTPGDRKTETRS